MPDNSARYKILNLAYQYRSNIGQLVEKYIDRMQISAELKIKAIEMDNYIKKCAVKNLIEQDPRIYKFTVLKSIHEIITNNEAMKTEFIEYKTDSWSYYSLNHKINIVFNEREQDKLNRIIEIKCFLSKYS